MKNILYRFIEGQTHFGMSRGAMMSLAINEPKYVALHSNSNTTPSMHHEWKEKYYFICKINLWKI